MLPAGTLPIRKPSDRGVRNLTEVRAHAKRNFACEAPHRDHRFNCTTIVPGRSSGMSRESSSARNGWNWFARCSLEKCHPKCRPVATREAGKSLTSGRSESEDRTAGVSARPRGRRGTLRPQAGQRADQQTGAASSARFRLSDAGCLAAPRCWDVKSGDPAPVTVPAGREIRLTEHRSAMPQPLNLPTEPRCPRSRCNDCGRLAGLRIRPLKQRIRCSQP
jgi:hypothetical protein